MALTEFIWPSRGHAIAALFTAVALPIALEAVSLYMLPVGIAVAVVIVLVIAQYETIRWITSTYRSNGWY